MKFRLLSLLVLLASFAGAQSVSFADGGPAPAPVPSPVPSSVPMRHSAKYQILFICTGDYFRSRTAQAYFNYWSDQKNLPWHAISRGVNIDTRKNPGVVSPDTLKVLDYLHIPHEYAMDQMPTQISAEDIKSSRYVVAMNKPEQGPMLEALFPEPEMQSQLARIYYWHITDTMKYNAALRAVTQNVTEWLNWLISSGQTK